VVSGQWSVVSGQWSVVRIAVLFLFRVCAHYLGGSDTKMRGAAPEVKRHGGERLFGAHGRQRLHGGQCAGNRGGGKVVDLRKPMIRQGLHFWPFEGMGDLLALGSIALQVRRNSGGQDSEVF
jgi:hypothetical protein